MSTLLIYTGGTIGMVRSPQGSLIPFSIENLLAHCPSVDNVIETHEIEAVSMSEIKDSSDFLPDDWLSLRDTILAHHELHDNVLILHGTDTMAFTASAISYLLSSFNKNIVLTGSQVPIAEDNSDGELNIINALSLLGKLEQNKIKGKTLLSFGGRTIMATTAYKVSTSLFDAFRGKEFVINEASRSEEKWDGLLTLSEVETNVCLIKLYPGIQLELVASNLLRNCPKGIVLETFGSGNMPQNKIFSQALANLVNDGTLVVNISQCPDGLVEMSKYQTGEQLLNLGVIDGKNMTTEAAITKLMLVLSVTDKNKVELMTKSFAGEIIE